MQYLMDASQAIFGGKTVAPRQLAVNEATEISRTLSVTSETLAAQTSDLTRANKTFVNLVEHAPFGIYIVDSNFCIWQISLGAVKAFANVQPVLGRDFAEVMRTIWPEKFAEDAISRFRHTLETGEPYHQSSLEEIRRDTGDDEAYDWQIERVTPPDGNFGVVCYYHDFTALKSAQAQLRESEIRFRQTFENAAVGVAHVGLEGQLLQVNQTLCSLLGYSVEELQTKTFQDITHPDDLNADLDNVRRLIAAEIQNYGMDKRFIRKDGGSIWVGLTVALRRDTAGAPLYFISVVRDISGRKAAQAHQEFLLNELAHRMKNQLSVIQSMAAQTARNAGSLKQFQEKFSERVQGLAVATDLLVSQRWTGAQLTELIQRQLMPFIPSADQLECNGPNVSISADATQTLGLALHELATNAVKHGAWSASGGRVSVSWQFVTNGATGNNLRVTWLEQGGPAVLPPTRKGFGHVVIEKVAAQRVGGEASLVFAPEGLIWTLTMPNRHIVNAAE
jgi:PAS domain S-box-containing protein